MSNQKPLTANAVRGFFIFTFLELNLCLQIMIIAHSILISHISKPVHLAAPKVQSKVPLQVPLLVLRFGPIGVIAGTAIGGVLDYALGDDD